MKPLFLFQRKMTPIRKLLMMKAVSGGVPLNEYTATGNPLSFETDVAKPLKSLLIPWTPSQSGSGDPSPENVRPISGVSGLTVWRTGRNIFDVSTYPFTASRRISGDDGTEGSNSSYKATLDFVPCGGLKGKKVTLNKRPGGNLPGIGFYASASESGFVSGLRNANVTAGEPWTFEIPSDAEYMRFTVQADATDIQIEVGEVTPSPYTPYVGTTIPVTFPALGKNLINDSEIVEHYIISEDGTVTDNFHGKYVDYTPVSNEEYTISAYIESGQQNYRLHGYDANKNWVEQLNVTFVSSGYYTYTFTPGTNIKYIRLSCNLASSEIQLERGSSRTAYEPYTNTVYGGSLDLTTGVMTVTHGIKVFTGSEGFTWINSGTKEIYTASNVFKGIKKGTSYIFGYSNMVKTSTDYLQGSVLSKPNAQGEGVLFGNIFEYWGLETQSGEALDTLLSTMQANGTPLTVVYELATPLVYQLTPVEILSLVGDNTIWSDTNGENTAVYLKRG